MKTYMKKHTETDKQWLLVDAKEKVLGKLASDIASILRGKNKVEFTPHVDNGDNVIVINAEKIVLTGNKWKDKIYYHHTGYPGGIKSINAEDLHAKKPTELLMHAVKGMLPKNSLGRSLMKNLRIYAGDQHPHAAQHPDSNPAVGV